MRVFLTNDFSDAIQRFPKEHMPLLAKTIFSLEKMKKKEIVESKDTMDISPDPQKGPRIYAYCIKRGLYFILAFKDKKMAIIADVIEWVGGETAVSWVYPEGSQDDLSDEILAAT